MKGPTLPLFLLFCLLAPVCTAAAQDRPAASGNGPEGAVARLEWHELPPLPDALGFGGPLVGVAGDALLVAGGANFPDGAPWDTPPGAKKWYAEIYALDEPGGTWQTVGALPSPRGYGASVAVGEDLWLIGGSDANRAFADVLRIRYQAGSGIEAESLPPLPEPTHYLAADRLNDRVLVLPGHRTVDASTTQHQFWEISTEHPERGWQQRPPCPGGPRIKSVGVAQQGPRGNTFFVFGGELPTREGVEVRREHLQDGYAYVPNAPAGTPMWHRVTGPPRAVTAAPAIAFGSRYVLVLSGAGDYDGLPGDHPGFAPEVLAYDTWEDRWSTAGDMLEGVVTTETCWWGDRIVVASGEVRPAVRTRRVQAADVPADLSNE